MGAPDKIKKTRIRNVLHLYQNMLKDEEKSHGFFRMNIEQFYRLSQLVGEEIRKQNTNYRRVRRCKPKQQF